MDPGEERTPGLLAHKQRFVVHRGQNDRVIVHRADCALLDFRYEDGGQRRCSDTLAGAYALAKQFGGTCGRYQVCGWCHPDAQ